LRLKKNHPIIVKNGIKVFAPASIGNIGVGFDILGCALEKPGDEIVAALTDAHEGLRITRITGGHLPLEPEKNTAGYAALKLLEHLGESRRGIDMVIHKKMPFGSGLGSSAASAAGAVLVVNELLKNPLSKRELLPFAVMGESIASGAMHADNVAPSLLGGIILARSSSEVHRLHTPKGLYATVIYPKINILTKDARNMLSPTVELKQLVQQTSNLAGFIVGLYNTDFDLIRRSLHDVVIEPQRAKLIPHFYEVQEAVLKLSGVLGCSISGSGPSIFALSQNTLAAEEAGIVMKRIFDSNKIENQLFISPINSEGAILL
jgi:homoserine kinase